jgi:hypothetical protein
MAFSSKQMEYQTPKKLTDQQMSAIDAGEDPIESGDVQHAQTKDAALGRRFHNPHYVVHSSFGCGQCYSATFEPILGTAYYTKPERLLFASAKISSCLPTQEAHPTTDVQQFSLYL